MKKIVKTLLLGFCMAMLTATQVSAAETTDFSGKIEKNGKMITVTLTADEGGACSGQVALSYDPEKVELVKADYGTAVKEKEIRSLNTAAQEGTAVEMGFADLEAVEAGELLTAEFKIIKEGVKEDYVFHAEVDEWSSAEVNDLQDEEKTGFDIVLKVDGSQGTTDNGSNGTTNNGSNHGSGTGGNNSGSNGKVTTGDDTNTTLWIAVCAVALAAAAGVIVYRRKRNG